MHYDRKVFVNQYPTVNRFISHLTYYQIIEKGYTERQMRNDFWLITKEAHLFAATMSWCKVFGSHGCNPTHWKHLSLDKQDMLAQSFRQELFQEIHLDEQRWRQYWDSIKDFRDKCVAHRELHFSEPVPNFNTALAVAYYYDKWVRRVISPDTLGDPPLEQFAKSLKESATPLVDKLLTVTKEPILRQVFLQY